MEVNRLLLKNIRSERGWTQQHLAEACGLSLRTIQRVEKTGSASHETVAAICAVYEINREALSTIPKVQAQQLQPVLLGKQWLALATVGGLGVVVGAGLMYWLLAAV